MEQAGKQASSYTLAFSRLGGASHSELFDFGVWEGFIEGLGVSFDSCDTSSFFNSIFLSFLQDFWALKPLRSAIL